MNLLQCIFKCYTHKHTYSHSLFSFLNNSITQNHQNTFLTTAFTLYILQFPYLKAIFQKKKKKKLTCIDSNRLHPCHLLRQCWKLLPQYLLRLPISLLSSIYMQILQQNYRQNFTNFTKAFKIKVLTPFIKRVPLIIKAQNFMIIIGFSY